MKFASLETSRGAVLVIVDTDRKSYVPVKDLALGFDGDLVDFILNTPAFVVPDSSAFKPLAGEKILAPLLPRRIFCVGKNYLQRVKEFSSADSSSPVDSSIPQQPVVFTKLPSTVIGPGDVIPNHARVTSQLDYEVELAVIIGKGGSAIAKEDAMSHVWGYTIVNDMTARDVVQRQWILGKSLDGFCPIGPYAVTVDEIEGGRADIKCWVNDELRQDSNTSQLIFGIPELIASISAGIELHPGDVIATGSPAGTGIGFTPPRFLASGDQLRLSVSGIGELFNSIE